MAECQRIDAFELWCWRKLLRVPWTARKSNLSILMEISPEYSLEGLMLKVKEKSEKAGLKPSVQKTKIMASSPITSWQIDGENVETVSDFIFLGSKINAEDNCSHEIKRPLLLGRIVLTNLDQCIWRRQWHPTPALLPGKSHGRRSLVGCSPWGR